MPNSINELIDKYDIRETEFSACGEFLRDRILDLAFSLESPQTQENKYNMWANDYKLDACDITKYNDWHDFLFYIYEDACIGMFEDYWMEHRKWMELI